MVRIKDKELKRLFQDGQSSGNAAISADGTLMAIGKGKAGRFIINSLSLDDTDKIPVIQKSFHPAVSVRLSIEKITNLLSFLKESGYDMVYMDFHGEDFPIRIATEDLEFYLAPLALTHDPGNWQTLLFKLQNAIKEILHNKKWTLSDVFICYRDSRWRCYVEEEIEKGSTGYRRDWETKWMGAGETPKQALMNLYDSICVYLEFTGEYELLEKFQAGVSADGTKSERGKEEANQSGESISRPE